MKKSVAQARLEAEVAKHPTQRDAAQHLGITQAYLSDLLRNRRNFSERILAKLGLERVVVEKS